MENHHVQAVLTRREYEALRQASQREGRSLKEALHEAILAWVRQRMGREDPLHQMVGIAKGPRDAAKLHDEIYDED